MAPVSREDLVGIFRVELDGKHEFNVRCTEVIPKPPVSDLRIKNSCITPLVFEFLPKPGSTKLPKWVSDSRPAKKTDIDQWGAPYNSFTCEVDGDTYIACARGIKKSAAGQLLNRIEWRLCNDCEDMCVWIRGRASDIADADSHRWVRDAGSKKYVWKSKTAAPRTSKIGKGSRAKAKSSKKRVIKQRGKASKKR